MLINDIFSKENLVLYAIVLVISIIFIIYVYVYNKNILRVRDIADHISQKYFYSDPDVFKLNSFKRSLIFSGGNNSTESILQETFEKFFVHDPNSFFKIIDRILIENKWLSKNTIEFIKFWVKHKLIELQELKEREKPIEKPKMDINTKFFFHSLIAHFGYKGGNNKAVGNWIELVSGCKFGKGYGRKMVEDCLDIKIKKKYNPEGMKSIIETTRKLESIISEFKGLALAMEKIQNETMK